MSGKAENTFLGAVNKKLPRDVYSEKMSNPYRGGTPDVFYEASQQLWVEYKFVEVPARGTTLIVPALSALQADWLQRNHDHGHEPWVIVGFLRGRESYGYIFRTPGAWKHGVTAAAMVEGALSKQQIADEIATHVTAPQANPQPRPSHDVRVPDRLQRRSPVLAVQAQDAA